jgi:hypothetical protein
LVGAVCFPSTQRAGMACGGTCVERDEGAVEAAGVLGRDVEGVVVGMYRMWWSGHTGSQPPFKRPF